MGRIADRQVTTFTTYRFDTFPAKIWAFRQMGLAGEILSRVAGLRFWKMLGSGKGAGFSLSPNWSRYALFCVWDSGAAADAFFGESALSKAFDEHATEQWSVRLRVARAQGLWDGQNPFENVAPQSLPKDGPITVLTRGSIKWNRLHRFWWHVPLTSRAIEAAPGVLASIGVGELPFVRQATLSFWENQAAMQNFAYRSSGHKEIVRKTRQENWYSEDLFARFVPIRSTGSWDGVDPLAGLLTGKH